MIDLRHLKGKRFAVMGLAKSGLATAKALMAAGVEILAWDDGEAGRAAATAAGIPLTDLNTSDLAGIEALLLSPGIPHTFPKPNAVALLAKAAGIPIIGDIELLYKAQPKAAYIGITGTNGKSTTTALIGHILGLTGQPVQVGGNLGTPVLTFEPLGEGGIYVLEMSSYQLELAPSVAFNVAVLLNVTPDHLDRHGGMDGYISAKRRIFQHPRRSHTAVIGVDDTHCRKIYDELEASLECAVVPVSTSQVTKGVYVLDGKLYDGGSEPVIDLNTIAALPGRHNWQNAAAAFAATHAASVPVETILEGLRSFPGLAHRQQLVAEQDGIRFVNDSKATNADAASKALVCYDPIYWIIGGLPKEGGLDGLESFMPRIRHAFVIGQASEQFATWLDAHGVPYTRCGDLETAVPAATDLARTEALSGATVLLSPACASWDQFKSFEHRGEVFAALVRTALNGAVSNGTTSNGAALDKKEVAR
jgi:UDP-N-acetylmuramoylalanine--D-glutamate ligase